MRTQSIFNLEKFANKIKVCVLPYCTCIGVIFCEKVFLRMFEFANFLSEKFSWG